MAQHGGEIMRGSIFAKVLGDRIRWVTTRGAGTTMLVAVVFILVCAVLLSILLLCVLTDATLADFAMLLR